MEPENKSVMEELLSARSALMMEPEAIEGEVGPFLADRDVWARHAVEHIDAALALLRRQPHVIDRGNNRASFGGTLVGMGF
jgi:hypothetical protein